MIKHQILLVDNDVQYAEVVAEILERSSYDVLTALSPAQARDVAAREPISLAIIGIRLIDDEDINDTSGIALAEEFKSKFPMIMLTSYASYEMMHSTLGLRNDGKSVAVDFIQKSEGSERLLESIEKNLFKQEEKIPGSEEEVIAFAFFDDKIKLVSLTPDGEYRFLGEAQNFHKILYITT